MKNPFKAVIIAGGFRLHWRYRFDPVAPPGSPVNKLFGGGGGSSSSSMPKVAASGNEKRTAGPVDKLSDQAKRNRILAASMITQDWGAPKLAKKGLLGMGGQELI